VELFETIRREHDRHRLGIRALARKFRVGRATVRRALSSAIPPEPRSPARAAPVMGPAKAFIDQVLVADRQVPRKQRNGDTDCAPRPAGGFTPGTPQDRLIELTELGLRHTPSPDYGGGL